MLAVLASGMSCMSEASMPFQPAMDEPSKAWPEVNLSSSKAETGTVTCCSLPRVSVKRKSMNLTSCSFTIFITSGTVLAIEYSCCTVVKKIACSHIAAFVPNISKKGIFAEAHHCALRIHAFSVHPSKQSALHGLRQPHNHQNTATENTFLVRI